MSRETLVLLPGHMCDQRLFAPQIEVFKDNYEIIVPDLVAPSIYGMAEAVLAEVQAQSFTVIGLSMGGIVTMAMMGLAPERLLRVGLLDTNPDADTPERRQLRDRQIADVQKGNLRKIVIDEMKPNYLAQRNESSPALLKILIDMAMDVGDETFVAQATALRDRPGQRDTLSNFEGPALILCGEEDRLCMPSVHREMSEHMPHAVFHIVSGAGHISTLEVPETVNDILSNFMSQPIGN